MADPKTQAMQVSLPGAGKTQTYQLSADTPIHFNFDLAEAVFTGKNGNLEIALEGGGTVILEGYQALADAGTLPTFEMMNGEVVTGDVYLFAFADVTDATAEELETAADGAASGSGAGEYSDDAGSLGDGLDALGGQDDAYSPNGAPTISGILGNIAPVANDDFAEVDEAGDPDLVVGKNIAFVEGYEGNYQDYIQGRDGAEIDPDQVTFLPTDDSGSGILLYNPNPPQGGATVSGEPGSVNYLVVLDTSGSMSDEMADAKAALVEMLETLQQQLNETGGTATIGIVDFDSGVQDVVTFQLSANTDPSDLTNAAIAYIEDPSNLYAGGGTNFETALDAAVDWVNDPSAGANGNETHTIFISDGYGGGGFEDELATLQAISNVIGVGIGSGADESALDNIDESGEAIIVNSAEDLNSILVDLINNTGPSSAEGNVIDNDYDPDGSDALLRMNVIDYIGENHDGVDEPGVEVISNDTVIMGKYGVLVIDPDGSWDYALNQEWADELNEGESFDEVFNYTIVDGEGAESNTASLTITVFGSNDMPVAVDDFNVQAVEYGDSTDYGLYADVDDAESGNVIVHDEDHQDYTGKELIGTPKQSALFDGDNDEPNGEPDDEPDNFFVQVTGNVLAGDAAGGGTDSDPDSGDLPDGQTTFVLGVYSHATMDLAYEVPVEGNTGEPFDFKAMHPDQTFDIATLPDGLDTSYTVQGEFGYLTIQADGDYFYTLYTPKDEEGYENLNALNYDNPGTDEFTYAIMDDSGAFSYANLTFTVNGANDAPEAFSNENSVIEFGEEHILAGLTEEDYTGGTATGNVITDENSEGMTDFDVDNDDVTGIFVESISHGEVTETVYNYDGDTTDYVTIDGDYGTLKIWEDGTYEYQVDNDNLDVQGLNYQGTLTETFTYVTTNKYEDGVNSEDASSEPATLTITINGTNDAPIGVDDVPTEVFVDDWSGAIALDSGDGYSIGGMTFTASIEGHESTLSVTSQGLGVSSWLLDDPAIDGALGDESIRIDFDSAMSSVEIELSGFHPTYPGYDDAKATMYDAEGNELGSVTLGDDNQDTGSTLSLSSENGNIAYVIIETAGDANDDFFIESVRATPAVTPEGGIVAVENVTESDVFHEGSYTTQGAVQVGGNVLANDWDYDNVDYPETGYPDGSTELSVTGVNAGVVADYHDVADNVSGSTATTIVGTYGTLTISADGQYSYTPDQLAAQQLNVDDLMPEVFTYTVQDPYGVERSATLTIQVQGTNDGPEAHNDYSNLATEAGDRYGDADIPAIDVSGNVLINDRDVDNTDYSDSSDPADIQLTVSKAFSWYNGDLDDLADDGGTSVLEGRWGTLTINADGSYTYEVDADKTQGLDEGNVVRDVFSYEVTDQGGKSDIAQLTFDVNGTNDNPNAVDNSNVVVELGDGPTEGPAFGPFSDDTAWGNVKLNDSDDDDWNYQLRINGIAKGDLDDDVAANYDADDFDGIGGMPTTIAGDWGTLTIDRFGQYQYTLNEGATDPLDTDDVEHDTFTYRVIDDNGDFDLATLTFTVYGNNDAPVAVDDYVSEYMQVTNAFEAADVDVTGAQQSISMDGITVTAYVDNDNKPWNNGDHRHPDLTTKELNGYKGIGVNSDKDIDSGEVDLTNKGEDEYLVVSMDSPAESVTIELGALFANSGYDGGRTEYAQATAWGRNANNQLVKLGTVDVSGDSDGLVEFTMEGYDFDIERIVLQPVTNYAGKNGNNSDFVLVSVEASSHTGIDEGQTEPVIIKIADILANDYDVDALDTVSFAGLVANSENGGWAEVVGDEIWFHVDADTNMNNGATNFEYSVTDGDLTSTATVHLEVNPTNDAPTAETFAVETNEDNAISIDVLAHADDVDLADNPGAGDVLSIDGITDPAHGTVEIVNGEVLYTPDADYNGPDSFTYTVIDGQGGSVTETVNVTVNPVNDLPIAVHDGYHEITITPGVEGHDAVYADAVVDDFDSVSGRVLTTDHISITALGNYAQLTDTGNGLGIDSSHTELEDHGNWDFSWSQGLHWDSNWIEVNYPDQSLGIENGGPNEGIRIDIADGADSVVVDFGQMDFGDLIWYEVHYEGTNHVSVGHIASSEKTFDEWSFNGATHDVSWIQLAPAHAFADFTIKSVTIPNAELVSPATPGVDSIIDLGSAELAGAVYGSILANDFDIDNTVPDDLSVASITGEGTEASYVNAAGNTVVDGEFGHLEVDLSTGEYWYTPDEGITHDGVDTFTYTVSDGGDVASSQGDPALTTASLEFTLNVQEPAADSDTMATAAAIQPAEYNDTDAVIFPTDSAHIDITGSEHSGADAIVIDADYLGSGGSTTISGFDMSQGDHLSLGNLNGVSVEISSTDDSSDLTLLFSDVNSGDPMTITLQGVMSDAHANIDQHVEITTSDDLNTLIQHIIDSPDSI